MSVFDDHLQFIHDQIKIEHADRAVYTGDYEKIRDFILSGMASTFPTFRKLFSGTCLYGSYPHNVRIDRPNEFDVLFKLNVPLHSRMNVRIDGARPGFVTLHFDDVTWEEITKCDLYAWMNDVVDDNNMLLRRSNLQSWLRACFKQYLDWNNTVLGKHFDRYFLKYSRRGLAHTVYAQSASRTIAIDFIPAVVFGRRDWFETPADHPGYIYNEWYALPKPCFGPTSTRKYAFYLCNPIAEKKLLHDKPNLKTAYRLIKSLRNQLRLKLLKSYLFTTVFLWKVENERDDYWLNSISFIFIDMLEELNDCFENRELPFFWNSSVNLLHVLSPPEMAEYQAKIHKAYSTLVSYMHQPKLSFARTASHFEILDH